MILAAIAAAAAAAAFVLYNTIVGAGRRKKRSPDESFLELFFQELSLEILRQPSIQGFLG